MEVGKPTLEATTECWQVNFYYYYYYYLISTPIRSNSIRVHYFHGSKMDLFTRTRRAQIKCRTGPHRAKTRPADPLYTSNFIFASGHSSIACLTTVPIHFPFPFSPGSNRHLLHTCIHHLQHCIVLIYV